MSPGGLAAVAALVVAILAAVALAYRVGFGHGRTAGDLDAAREELAELEDGISRSRTAAQDYQAAAADLARSDPVAGVRRLWGDAPAPRSPRSGPGPASGPDAGPAECDAT